MTLIKNDQNKYTIQNNQFQHSDTPETIFAILEALGVSDEEIDFALTVLTKYGHKTAVFGLNKTITHTY